MLKAKNPKTGSRINATAGQSALCPVCDQAVISKCGEIVIHHWAHRVIAECDPWKEHETDWHRRWKMEFPEEFQEVTRADASGKRHRADVLLPNDTSIEFQHSAISPQNIKARESFWGIRNLVWVFDFGEEELRHRVIGPPEGSRMRASEHDKHGPGYSFRWKSPRKALWDIRAAVFLDWGNGLLFNVREITPKIPCFGFGTWRNRKYWIEDVLRKARIEA